MENEGEKTVRGGEEGGKRITQRRIERERKRERSRAKRLSKPPIGIATHKSVSPV